MEICINYIALNQVTKVMFFPIPCYDNATMYEFGDGRFYFLLDCPMGYHRIEVNERSREKLALAGPDAKLFIFRVLLFRPVNGPYLFITMMIFC